MNVFRRVFKSLSMRLWKATVPGIVRRRYAKRLEELRRDFGKRKLRVAFLVSDLAKWKGQSVYDALRADDGFEPFMAVGPADAADREDAQRRAEGLVAQFKARGMRACLADEAGKIDILFYQQPWEIPERMEPERISKEAITFYFPYYLENYNPDWLEVGNSFMDLLAHYIVASEAQKEVLERARREMGRRSAGCIVALGHPMVDAIAKDAGKIEEENLVIYAPHWTVSYGDHVPMLRYSTFLENGRLILDFAKSHREIKWAFKPHPRLKRALEESGAMTKEEAERYYGEWEEVGTACYDDGYVPLFHRSRAMITDCGSFLTEYACTGKPMIRLVNRDLATPVHPSLKALYGTYYESRSNGELKGLLESVVARGEDPKKAARQEEVKRANLAGMCAAERITKYMRELFGGKNV